MKKLLPIFLFATLIISGCEDEDLKLEPILSCIELEEGLIERNSEDVEAIINVFLNQYEAKPTEEDEFGHYETFKALIKEINSCPSLEVSYSCYNCIETFPPQSEIVILLFENGQEIIRRKIDLQIKDEKLLFFRMHDYLTEEMESFYYEETHCSDPWDRAGTVSDEVLKTQVSEFLKDPLSVDFSGLRVTHDGKAEICEACFCRTGRIIRFEADKAYQDILKEHRFKISEKATQNDCIDISQHPDWPTEEFKQNYRIQFPDNYEGTGRVGFEGFVFNKNRLDDQVNFSYAYCGPTYCEDFGDVLASPAPDFIKTEDKKVAAEILDVKVEFCEGGEVKGLLYYNTSSYATGKYFMKQGSDFRESLTIQFANTEYQEVENIIKTIISVKDL